MTMTVQTAYETGSRTIGRVAVGVDLSAAGLAALSWATEEAIASGARITICHARDHGDPRVASPDLEALELTQPGLVRRVRWCRQLLGGGNVTVELPIGDVPSALLDLSERAGLLVLGGHDTARRRHRSRVGQIAAAARCPVAIVRPVAGHGGNPFAGHVVIGVDGSPGSAAAVRFGFAHARRHHLPVAVVHVDNHWPGDFWFDERFLETHFTAEPAGLELLAREIAPMEGAYPGLAIKRGVFGGDAATGLRHAATGAALLVLGRHGHRIPALPRLGSVNHAFTERADCTVVIVPDSAPAKG